MADQKIKTRLGVWWFGGDCTGVHQSDIYFIEAMMPYLSKLVVVCGMGLNEEDSRLFLRWTPDIFIYDAVHCTSAYAKALDALPQSELTEYDEILFFDRSLIGPFQTLDAMFDTMDKRACDFWGLHWVYKHGVSALEKERLKCSWYTDIPDYIPWSFFAVRKPMILAPIFGRMMNRAKQEKDAGRAEYRIEMLAADQFIRAGYNASAYLDTEPIRAYAYNPLLTAPYRAVVDLKSPFLYARLFHMDMSETLEYALGQTTADTLAFIEKETAYDMDMLYDHILKLGHQHDIKNAFGLTFSLPSDHDIPADDRKGATVALCMHLYYEDLFDDCLQYAASMPEYADLIITTNTEEKKKTLEQKIGGMKFAKREVRVIGNRGT